MHTSLAFGWFLLMRSESWRLFYILDTLVCAHICGCLLPQIFPLCACGCLRVHNGRTVAVLRASRGWSPLWSRGSRPSVYGMKRTTDHPRRQAGSVGLMVHISAQVAGRRLPILPYTTAARFDRVARRALGVYVAVTLPALSQRGSVVVLFGVVRSLFRQPIVRDTLHIRGDSSHISS